MEYPFPPGCAARYRPLRLLGTGGFGAVHLAEQAGLDRKVAVKLLHPELVNQPDLLQRFVQEARVTATVAHPHVVKLIDFGVEGAQPWLVYEYLEGQSLAARLLAGPIPWREALEAVRQIAGALHAVHERQLLHRDVKPDNILQVAAESFVLIDFGIAKSMAVDGVRTQAGIVIGTPEYMSPEQIRGDPLTPHLDIYALGVTLFELLTRRRPFRAKDPSQLFELQLHARPPALSTLRADLPADLDPIVQRALAKQPADRFGTAEEFQNALDEALVRSKTPPQQPTPAHRAAPHPAAEGSGRGEATVARPGARVACPAAAPSWARLALVGAVVAALSVLGTLWATRRIPPGPPSGAPVGSPSGAKPGSIVSSFTPSPHPDRGWYVEQIKTLNVLTADLWAHMKADEEYLVRRWVLDAGDTAGQDVLRSALSRLEAVVARARTEDLAGGELLWLDLERGGTYLVEGVAALDPSSRPPFVRPQLQKILGAASYGGSDPYRRCFSTSLASMIRLTLEPNDGDLRKQRAQAVSDCFDTVLRLSPTWNAPSRAVFEQVRFLFKKLEYRQNIATKVGWLVDSHAGADSLVHLRLRVLDVAEPLIQDPRHWQYEEWARQITLRQLMSVCEALAEGHAADPRAAERAVRAAERIWPVCEAKGRNADQVNRLTEMRANLVQAARALRLSTPNLDARANPR